MRQTASLEHAQRRPVELCTARVSARATQESQKRAPEVTPVGRGCCCIVVGFGCSRVLRGGCNARDKARVVCAPLQQPRPPASSQPPLSVLRYTPGPQRPARGAPWRCASASPRGNAAGSVRSHTRLLQQQRLRHIVGRRMGRLSACSKGPPPRSLLLFPFRTVVPSDTDDSRSAKRFRHTTRRSPNASRHSAARTCFGKSHALVRARRRSVARRDDEALPDGRWEG